MDLFNTQRYGKQERLFIAALDKLSEQEELALRGGNQAEAGGWCANGSDCGSDSGDKCANWC